MFTPPDLNEINLDDLSVNPNDLDVIAKHFDSLARYARHKSSAMRLRAEGSIRSATAYETACDRIYASLPKSWRW